MLGLQVEGITGSKGYYLSHRNASIFEVEKIS